MLTPRLAADRVARQPATRIRPFVLTHLPLRSRGRERDDETTTSVPLNPSGDEGDVTSNRYVFPGEIVRAHAAFCFVRRPQPEESAVSSYCSGTATTGKHSCGLLYLLTRRLSRAREEFVFLVTFVSLWQTTMKIFNTPDPLWIHSYTSRLCYTIVTRRLDLFP